MGYVGESRSIRRVRVTGRDDVGEVIQEGKSLGGDKNMYCVVVHFSETGEVCFYDRDRVETFEG